MFNKRQILAFISLLMGVWMIFNSSYALLNGRYFGSSELGLWADLLDIVGIDPFSFAPGFLALGILWLVSCFMVIFLAKWWRQFVSTTAVLSVWYIPFGTFLSLVAIVMILSGILPRRFQRYRIGLIGSVAAAVVTVILLRILETEGAI